MAIACKSPPALRTVVSIRLTYQRLRAVETAVPVASLPVEVTRGDAHSDQELLSRARAGDPEAFRVIFDRQAPGVRRFLGDLLRDDAAADEGTQETFVRAHQRLGTLSGAEKLQGWLMGIARMVFFEQLRRKRRDGPQLDDEPVQVDRSPTPEAALLAGEADQVLDVALRDLSEERRAALLMRIDHGLGYGDIAEAMGWPLQKVKNEIHRARLQLRARLAAYLDGVA
jgi:RNA polymerase sigma factor (sigma-70 family)